MLDHLEKLVVKDVAEAGGYGVVFGSGLTRDKLAELKELIRSQPRRFIAQEVVDFQDMEIVEGSERVLRKADLRAFVLSGKETRVWASGLTRFSRNADSFVVNSSREEDLKTHGYYLNRKCRSSVLAWPVYGTSLHYTAGIFSYL